MRIVDGRGKIVPDSFAETRLLSLPRGVTAVCSLPVVFIFFQRDLQHRFPDPCDVQQEPQLHR